MDKKALLARIVQQLEAVYQNAIDAANRAHQSATDTESIAENKYDTQGLEAAYLAEGQARRVHDCEQDLREFQSFVDVSDSQWVQRVGFGTYVVIEDSAGNTRQLFMSQVAGGLKFDWQGSELMLITPSAPLGKAMQGLEIGDEFEVSVKGEKKTYFISALS